MANIIRLGSLYLNDCPAEIGLAYKPGKTISIGETAPGKEIHWVVVNDMLIADRCILTNVSWDDLNAQNLVFGKEIAIGGFHFIVRLLQVGAKERVPNEWDAALDVAGEGNDIWHWERESFWGSETDFIGGGLHDAATRGLNFSRYWIWSQTYHRERHCGYRPVLVPLPTGNLDDIHPGEQMMLWSGQNIVFGSLEELTDYDIVLSNIEGALNSDFGSRLSDGGLVIDRASISGVQKIQ